MLMGHPVDSFSDKFPNSDPSRFNMSFICSSVDIPVLINKYGLSLRFGPTAKVGQLK
jgi:hypothetical protein